MEVEEVVEVDVEVAVTEVVSAVEAEVVVTVVDEAEVVVEEHQEDEEAEVEAEVEEEWEEGRKFTLRPIAMKECSLPEEKRMLLSQRTWPSETPSMVKSALLLRKKVMKGILAKLGL